MLCSQIISTMNKIVPENFALDWDNVGLIVGRRSQKINKILIGLDLTDEIIDEALTLGANMIITHHPILFTPMKKISDTAESNRIIKLIKNDICLYVAHTNLDIADYGTNFTLFNLLELEKMESFEDLQYGSMGRVGVLKNEMKLDTFTNFVKNKLKLEKINFYGNKDEFIKKVAICSGSASHVKYFLLAKEKCCNVYLTGDIKYHDVFTAHDLNLNLIDITHNASEKIFAPALKSQLEKYCSIEILCANDKLNFFHIL